MIILRTAELVKRIPSWCGVLEALDDASCTLSTGADSVEVLAAQVALIGTDFEIIDPREGAGAAMRATLPPTHQP
jgi:hypothetical protein